MPLSVMSHAYNGETMIIKSQIVLYMYDKLLSKEGFTIFDIMSTFNISERTFRRYVSEINCYLANNYKTEVVSYDSDTKKYFFKNEK